MLGKPRRLAILAEGSFSPEDGKTAVSVLRYRAAEVAAVIDSTRAGRTTESCAGVGGATPMVRDLDSASKLGADSLLIGVAPQGGELPVAWRPTVRAALERGWDVLSGLHAFLSDDSEFAAAAAESGAVIHDLRRPPSSRRVAAGRAEGLEATVVLTVGSDCNVGKMTAAIEIARALESQGRSTAFVATGQTGMLISDRGATVDAVVADFIAGTVEQLVVEAAQDADFVIVEGQGALHHPGYSGVTLGLIHGACPAALVLCHRCTRDRMKVSGGPPEGWPIPSLLDLRAAYEVAAGWVRKARVVGVALNTLGLDEAAARDACEAARHELGVPATDPVRFGAAPLEETIAGMRRLRATAP